MGLAPRYRDRIPILRYRNYETAIDRYDGFPERPYKNSREITPDVMLEISNWGNVYEEDPLPERYLNLRTIPEDETDDGERYKVENCRPNIIASSQGKGRKDALEQRLNHRYLRSDERAEEERSVSPEQIEEWEMRIAFIQDHGRFPKPSEVKCRLPKK